MRFHKTKKEERIPKKV